MKDRQLYFKVYMQKHKALLYLKNDMKTNHKCAVKGKGL